MSITVIIGIKSSKEIALIVFLPNKLQYNRLNKTHVHW